MKAVLYPFGRDEAILALARDFAQLEWAVVHSPAEVAREIGDAAILVTSNRVCSAAYGEALRANATGSLRWIHFTSAGIEKGLRMGLPAGVTVTNSTGVKAAMVSEHALALLLALVRRLPRLQADQRERRWRHDEALTQVGTLEGAVVCVIGLGSIGRAVARKARAFDARVIAVSREGVADGEVEEVFRRARIGEALARADAVVVCTSSDPMSFHLIGAEALAALSPRAVLINVARGDLVDGEALVAALRAGRLAGARCHGGRAASFHKPALGIAQRDHLPACRRRRLERLHATESFVRRKSRASDRQPAVAQHLSRLRATRALSLLLMFSQL